MSVVAEGRAAEHGRAAASTSGASLRQLVSRVSSCVGALAGAEVGDDVAAAERVDGLLRVADQHQRGLADEGALDDLPLDRVGVLELVDHHDRPAPAHPVAGGCVVGLERDGQPAEQVVEAQDAEQALAPLELLAARRRRTRGGRRPPVSAGGSTGVSRVRGLRTTSRASPSAWARVSSGVSFSVAEALEVEVVDDLGRPARRGSRRA